MRHIRLNIIVFLLTLLGGQNIALAQDVMMVRSSLRFPEAMAALQNSVIAHKYTLSRIQRVDIGLTRAGYKTDRYRIVFFGKQSELEKITDRHPEMAAFLPLKLVIFAEGDETIVVALNPLHYRQVVDDYDMNILYQRWANDIRSIMDDVSHAE